MKTERELFEAWAKKETNWDLYWSENIKQYMDHQTNGAWLAWQSRVPEGYVVVPKEPTQAMLDSARDWSTKKYGKAVGNDGASGCYKAMLEAVEK